MEIKPRWLSVEHFNNEVSYETQFVLHHTASGGNPETVIDGWAATTDRVGAHLVIGGKTPGSSEFDGVVYQAVPFDKWLWHLGIPAGVSHIPHGVIDSQSIGIEICNWGPIVKNGNGHFVNYVGGVVPDDEVVELSTAWRGYVYWHAYTDAQLATLKVLLPQLSAELNIPIEKGRVFTAADFETDVDEFAKKPLAFHVNFRHDKFDLHIDPKLIATLNEIHT